MSGGPTDQSGEANPTQQRRVATTGREPRSTGQPPTDQVKIDVVLCFCEMYPSIGFIPKVSHFEFPGTFPLYDSVLKSCLQGPYACRPDSSPIRGYLLLGG